MLTRHNISIWNFAAAHSLIIVTANSPHEAGQRVDIEILDGSERGNVYLSKKVCLELSVVVWIGRKEGR